MLGHLFGIMTVFQLLELANPSQPLMRRLLVETPGTYHHSLLVGNLAERAAEVIGADPLVARVGAYYHDIGKMRNPTAFIENQTGHNPHDELDPLVSAGIVAAHVKDGLALADRYRLPARIREMIPGHHGNSVVKYFFQLAQQRGQAAADAQIDARQRQLRMELQGSLEKISGLLVFKLFKQGDADVIGAIRFFAGNGWRWLILKMGRCRVD